MAIALVAAGKPGFDLGRAAQNMMLSAWNDGVTSCPNGVSDAEAAAALLGLAGEERVANVISFGYPARPRDPESLLPEEWLVRAKRKPLEEISEHR